MIIDEKLIELDLTGNSRLEVIEELCNIAYEAGRLFDKNEFLNRVLFREEEVTTDLGQGIAIPHGKSDSVKESFILFAKLSNPIVWNEVENSKIDLIFMIGVPETNGSNIHLKLISQIATKFVDEDFVKELRNSRDKNTVINCFKNIKI